MPEKTLALGYTVIVLRPVALPSAHGRQVTGKPCSVTFAVRAAKAGGEG
jgi:hypothetical protein